MTVAFALNDSRTGLESYTVTGVQSSYIHRDGCTSMMSAKRYVLNIALAPTTASAVGHREGPKMTVLVKMCCTHEWVGMALIELHCIQPLSRVSHRDCCNVHSMRS